MNLMKLFEEVLSSAEQFKTLHKMSPYYDKDHVSYSDYYGQWRMRDDYLFFNIELRIKDGKTEPYFGLEFLVQDRKEIDNEKFFYSYYIYNDTLPPKESGEDKEIWDFLEGKASLDEIIDYMLEKAPDQSEKVDEIFELFGKDLVEKEFNEVRDYTAKSFKKGLNKVKGINAFTDRTRNEYSDRFKQYYDTLMEEWEAQGGPKLGQKVEALVKYGRNLSWINCRIRDIRESHGNTILTVEEDAAYMYNPSGNWADLYGKTHTWEVPLNRCRPNFSDFNYGSLDNSKNISKYLDTYPDTTGYDTYQLGR